jgi:hypothetical protein
MVATDGVLTDDGFREIGRAAPALRERVGSVVKNILEQSELMRQRLVDSGALDKFSPEVRAKVMQVRADPWPEYAQVLLSSNEFGFVQ